MTNEQPSRDIPDPSDSMLMTLARMAMDADSAPADLTWPHLDLDDPAQRQFGDYELLEEIDRGGMGVVYRAHQRSLDREVAIKFIAAGIADSFNVARFLGEARAAARLLHPNIVPVHEVGSVEGVHYFSMPLVKGQTLASRLQAGTLAPPVAVALVLKLAEAIDYAHRLGLLHLDLKPANVLIDERGEPQIADFGLARHVDDQGGVDAQEVSGTPAFMAPEQILIKQYRLTPATDLYALGAILYRCLTGHSPHGEGKPDDVIRRAAAGRIRPARELNPQIPRDLDAICMKCLELQPSDRYASATQLADDLRRVRDGLPVSVRRIGALERMQRWFRREPKLAFASTAAVLALLVGATATTWQWQQTTIQRDAARGAQAEATAQRDRATIAGEIGAHLFAYQGDEDERADDLLRWLRKRIPDNADRQADALAVFMKSVGTEKTGDAESLMNEIVAVLGSDYRRQMIRALVAGTDPHRHLYSALLTYNDSTSASGHASGTKTGAALEQAVQAALDESPDDPLVQQVAAVYCTGPEGDPACRARQAQAAERLARLDPDNMYVWVLVATTATDARRRREALHQAAQRGRYDDYLGRTFTAYANAIKSAGVPPPPLITRPLQVISPHENVESAIAYLEAAQFPLSSFVPMMTQCGYNAGDEKAIHPQVRADCRVVGETMMRSRGGLISQMIGVALVRLLAKGDPVAEQATQVRRLYVYLTRINDGMNPGQQARYTSTRMLRDIASVGEMAALQRRAKFLGFPDQPPAGWTPDDPVALQSSRERHDSAVALHRHATSLIAQGKYADAVALLESARKQSRHAFGSDWLLARNLTSLGRARIGLRDFPGAESALQDAWGVAGVFGPGSNDARACAQAMVDLYAAWNTSEPSRGYDLKAGAWKQTLARLTASAED